MSPHNVLVQEGWPRPLRELKQKQNRLLIDPRAKHKFEHQFRLKKSFLKRAYDRNFPRDQLFAT